MMTSKPQTKRKFYLLTLTLFLGMSLHFYLLNDLFFTFLLMFCSLLNLIAFFQIPKKVGNQSILINLFNGIFLLLSSYNYGELDKLYLGIACIVLAILYIIGGFRQLHLRRRYVRHKKKKSKKFS